MKHWELEILEGDIAMRAKEMQSVMFEIKTVVFEFQGTLDYYDIQKKTSALKSLLERFQEAYNIHQEKLKELQRHKS
jgi:hypothetical protein